MEETKPNLNLKRSMLREYKSSADIQPEPLHLDHEQRSAIDYVFKREKDSHIQFMQT